MKIVADGKICGCKAFNNTVEGVLHNYTKIYVETPFGETGFGYSTAEYKWGTSENIKKIQDLQYPFNAKITMEIVTNGNKTMTIIHDVVPVQGSAPKSA